MTESLTSPASLPGDASAKQSGCITIAGYRRIAFFLVLAPFMAFVFVTLYSLVQEAINGFPNPRALRYAIPFVAFLGLFLVKFSSPMLWGLHRIFLTREPALFIQDGALIYIREDHFRAPVADVEVSVSPYTNRFQKLLVKCRGEQRLAIGLMFLDRPGQDIVDAVNAYRSQHSA